MANNNTDLPEKLQSLFELLTPLQGVPIGTNEDVPYILLKVNEEDMAYIEANDITAEFKPSIINVALDEQVIAILFVQIKLAGIERLIFTLTYDVTNEKHYVDAHALLKMKQYSLIIGTQNTHKILAFTPEFDASFDPIEILASARNNATEYNLELFHQLSQFIITSHENKKALWDHFNEIASIENKWYAHLKMQKP